MKFEYHAKGKNNEDLTGEREAKDRFELAREMRSDGLTLISAKPKAERTLQRFFAQGLFGQPSVHDKIIFASSLSAMIEAGLPLSRALAVLERQTPKAGFKKIIAEVSERIRRGEAFSSALAAFRTFPRMFVSMVAAGEESGDLPNALKIVAEQLEKGYNLKRKVRGALIYPAIIICAVIAIGILMMIFLVPNLVSLFDEIGAELPLSTRIVIAISNFLSGHTLTFLLGLLVLVAGAIYALQTNPGRKVFAWLALHLPVIKKIIKEYQSAVTMRTISSLVSAGVGMIDTLNITKGVVQNPYYQTILGQAADVIQKGQPLSRVFKTNEEFYPPLVGEMSEVGEETGKLSEMLMKGALFYEGEVDQATKNLSTIIEPVLMIFIGLAVGFFAISMIGPIYSLTEKL